MKNKKNNKARAQKKTTSPELKKQDSGLKWVCIWGTAGAVAVFGFLTYWLVISPKRPQVNLSDAPSYNILLITLDTTRADHLGCYGYETAKTPHIDSLAQEGIRFARAYCPAPLTLPSHCSIMSGLYPASHGVHNNGHIILPGINMLAEILKDLNFNTAAFVSSFSVDSRFGIDQGFDVYDDTFQSNQPLKSPNAERRAEETFFRFSRWLEKNWQSKFFAWIHYFDPHLPYNPPLSYKEEFNRNLYDGEIAYMDHYVGAAIELLEAKGIIEKTIIIVAGDHGEGLGDKVETGHGIFLYEETLRVPLIFYNLKVFPRSQVIESMVRLIDVPPTILEIIGQSVEAAGMQGQSLVPWLKGTNKQDIDSLIETFYPRDNFGWSELVGLVSDQWKFIQAPQCELYDLKNDPTEEINLYGQSLKKTREMTKKLEQVLLGLSLESKSSEGQTTAKTEDLEKLRSLGYLSFAPAKPGSVFPDPKEKINLLRLIQQAQKFELEERFPEAEKAYSQILKDIPDSPEAYVNLAITQARQNKYDLAVETLKQGMVRIENSEVLSVRLGHTYLVMGKFQEALESMEKALSINPQNINALTICASILESIDKKEESRFYYERALAIEPENQQLRTSFAANLASGGKLEEAIKVYETLIKDFPEEQAYYQFMGIAWSYLGEFDKAIFFLQQALAIKPTPTGYFNLAVAYDKSDQFQQAIKYFKLYLENSQGESKVNIQKAKVEIENLEKKLGQTR